MSNDSHVRQWLTARRIIADFLKEIAPWQAQEQLDHNAAAIIVRLAQNEPPILLASPDELKDEE